MAPSSWSATKFASLAEPASAETSPTASESGGFEVRIRTDQHYTTDSGTRISAWTIYDELPTSQANDEDEEAKLLLRIVSGKELPG